MKKTIRRIVGGLAISLPLLSYGVTVGELQHPTRNFLDCDDASSGVKGLCIRVQNDINQRLANAGLSITRNALIFNRTENINREILSGCTRRTNLNNGSLRLKITDSADIDLSGSGTVSDPAIFALTLPVEVYSRFNLKDRLGVTYYDWKGDKKCRTVATDTYYADSLVNTEMQLSAFFSLEPRYAMSANGDHVIKIKPRFDLFGAVDAQIRDIDIHGASPLSGLLGSITATPNALNNQLDNIFNGGSVEEIFLGPVFEPLMETAIGALLTDYSLGNPTLIDRVVELYAQELANEKVADANKRISDVTRSIEAKFKSALGLNSSGEAYFVFGPDYRPKNVEQRHIDTIHPKTVLASAGSYGNTMESGCFWGTYYGGQTVLNCRGGRVATQLNNFGSCTITPTAADITIEGGSCSNFKLVHRAP